jgi:hypothetical protein
MIMCSADDTSGENTGGSEPGRGVPAGGVTARTEPDTDAGGEDTGRGPHDLTPYLALVISAYGATKSVLATAVAAVLAVIAAIMNCR